MRYEVASPPSPDEGARVFDKIATDSLGCKGWGPSSLDRVLTAMTSTKTMSVVMGTTRNMMEKCTSIVALIKSPPLLLVSREKKKSTPFLF